MSCQHEQTVVRQLIAGGLHDAIRHHVKSCDECEETAIVAKALQRDASLAMHDVALPACNLVLWKAQLHARREKMNASTRPIDLASLVPSVLGLLSGGLCALDSGAFSRLAAMPAALAASVLAVIVFTAAPIWLSKRKE